MERAAIVSSRSAEIEGALPRMPRAKRTFAQVARRWPSSRSPKTKYGANSPAGKAYGSLGRFAGVLVLLLFHTAVGFIALSRPHLSLHTERQRIRGREGRSNGVDLEAVRVPFMNTGNMNRLILDEETAAQISERAKTRSNKYILEASADGDATDGGGGQQYAEDVKGQENASGSRAIGSAPESTAPAIGDACMAKELGADNPSTSASSADAPDKRGWGAGFRKRKGNPEGEGGGDEKKGLFTYDWENGPRVKWTATKKSRVVVEEGPRKLNEYLALPPTEYSLLDPNMITRLTESTFKMDCGTLNIVGTKVNPMLFVKVDVQPDESKANIIVERVELDGSEAVRSSAGTFNVTSSTVVSSGALEDGAAADNMMELRTQADIEIELLVPNENFVPVGVLRRAGNFVMQRVCDIGLPQFTRFLRRDYARWAEGDNSRAAVVTEGERLIDSPDT